MICPTIALMLSPIYTLKLPQWTTLRWRQNPMSKFYVENLLFISTHGWMKRHCSFGWNSFTWKMKPSTHSYSHTYKQITRRGENHGKWENSLGFLCVPGKVSFSTYTMLCEVKWRKFRFFLCFSFPLWFSFVAFGTLAVNCGKKSIISRTLYMPSTGWGCNASLV